MISTSRASGVALVLLTVALFSVRTLAQSPADGRVERLGALVDAYAKLGQLSGVVLVAEGDRILLRRGAGESDREFHVAARPEHRFLIGSMTKAFTAVLALQQVARGRLSLDAPVLRYWPEFPDPSHGAITVRHLLTHQSGLRHWGGVEGFLDSAAKVPHTPTDIVARYAAKGLEFTPGTREDYSSIGYLALGVVLERVSGKAFPVLLHDDILAPLRMTSTSLDDHDTIVPGRARPYRFNFLAARYDNAEYRDASTAWSTGGILTTVDDLLLWSRALATSALLPDSLRALMFDRTNGDAWYGWRVDTIAGARGYWHVGLETGFHSQILRIPARRQTVIVLGNLRDMDTDGLTRRIVTILGGGVADLPQGSVSKAIYAAAATGGGAAAAALFKSIVAHPAGYDTSRNQALIAAIELRNDKACDRAAPVYDAWLNIYGGESHNTPVALAGAADCRLLLGERERARDLIEQLSRVDPSNARLADLRRRLQQR